MSYSRDRACAAVLNPAGTHILMVHHRHNGREYWTLPGGGVEDRETFREAAVREVFEETGLTVQAGPRIFDETYDHKGFPSLCRCFWAEQLGAFEPVLGHDPEEADREVGRRMLQDAAWQPLSVLREDVQVRRVLAWLDEGGPSSATADTTPTPGFFRIHTRDLAYATQRPRGLFVAVGRLVENGTLSPDEVKDYWTNRRWFEEVLPVPPFYADGNSVRAITWYKASAAGNEMAERMGFYRRMASKYGVELVRTETSTAPGAVIYEDEVQIGVVDSRHGGDGFRQGRLV